MDRSTLCRAVTAVAVAAAALLAGTAGPASAAVDDLTAKNSIKIAKTGGVYGDGAVVLVDVDVKCVADAEYASFYVRVTQVAEWGTTSGEWGMDVACTGTSMTQAVAIPGFSPFSVGEAFVTAELQVCAFDGCVFTDAVRTVKVEAGSREVKRYRSPDLKFQLPGTGQLQAGGAGAVVLVPYTCAPGSYGSFDALLAQSSASGYVNFSGDSAELSCTASNRTGVLAFHASGDAWTAGAAFLLVNGYSCASEFEQCKVGSTYRSTKLA